MHWTDRVLDALPPYFNSVCLCCELSTHFRVWSLRLALLMGRMVQQLLRLLTSTLATPLWAETKPCSGSLTLKPVFKMRNASKRLVLRNAVVI